MKLGTTELILILVVALVVFGPSRLPKLGKMAGRMVGKTKKQIQSFEDEWEDIEDSVKKPLDTKKKSKAEKAEPAAEQEAAEPVEAPEAEQAEAEQEAADAECEAEAKEETAE